MLLPAWQLRRGQEEERAGREEATAAYMKLQDIIVAVRTDLEEAQQAADRSAGVCLCACTA